MSEHVNIAKPVEKLSWLVMRASISCGEALPHKQQRALLALLASNSIAEAAKACRMSQVTLFRFLNDDKFKEQYRLVRSLVMGHAIAQMQRDTQVAARTLREVCEDRKAPAAARVSAAKAILEGATKGAELDLVARVEELEKMQKKG